MRTYYFSINGKQVGPVTLDHVPTLGITPTTLAWYEGLDNWAEAAAIPEFAPILATRHNDIPVADTPDAPVAPAPATADTCPPNHLGLSIFSAIMFPLGIAAIVKSSLVKFRWNQGRIDDALWLSDSARRFAIRSIIIGAIIWSFYLIYMTLGFIAIAEEISRF